MNALLVYPKYPDTFWSFKHALWFVSRKASFPPLGLLTVASMLPGDWSIRLIDANVERLSDEKIRWADFVFISAMLVQKDSAQEIINRCHKLGKKVVAGGPAFTTSYNEFHDVDHLVLNEAENTLPKFLKDLKAGILKPLYTSEARADLSATPPPMWSLINFKDYAGMALQFSRGCPFNCEFCDIIIMDGRTPRLKSIVQMIAELEALYKSGYRGRVFFVDDNFIGNKNQVEKLLIAIGKWQKNHNFPFSFLTEASTNLAEETRLMKLMRISNFDGVFLGIETMKPESIRECKKHQNERDLAEAVKIIQQNGMMVMGGFIVGFDNDDESIFQLMAKFIQECGITTAMVGMLTALPKTALFKRLQKEGRLIGASTGENTSSVLNFESKMGNNVLLKGYRELILRIYSSKYYYQTACKFIFNYRKTVRKGFSWQDFKAFSKSIIRIGVFSSARFHYWKLLFKTLFINPKALGEAVEIAIFGLHFKRIAQRINKF